MILADDRAYFMRRAREEQRKAADAADPCAYRAHIELAHYYEGRVQSMARQDVADGKPGPASLPSG